MQVAQNMFILYLDTTTNCLIFVHLNAVLNIGLGGVLSIIIMSLYKQQEEKSVSNYSNKYYDHDSHICTICYRRISYHSNKPEY